MKQPVDAATTTLTSTQAETVLRTLRSALTTVNSEASVLHNPYDESGKYKADDRVELTPTASAANDEETTKRWRNKALKLMVRRKPETAEDLIESRVAVVGNVVRPLPLCTLPAKPG